MIMVIKERKTTAIVAYLTWLGSYCHFYEFIPKNEFARFHIRQAICPTSCFSRLCYFFKQLVTTSYAVVWPLMSFYVVFVVYGLSCCLTNKKTEVACIRPLFSKNGLFLFYILK